MRDLDFPMISRLLVMVIMFALVGYLFYEMIRMDKENTEKQAGKIEEILNNAVIQCYALEGSYPPNVEYLQNYGVILNERKYIYRYEFFFENVGPNITVIAR
jgi:competence protein ComGC